MFKRYDQKQQFLLPFNLEEFVPENHIARVLNDIIDVIDISAIESTYSEEGCPAYHPRLLLKILLYGYLINIRSSRKIEQMTQTDTAFMYLAAMQKPDFHTICRFRSTHLGPIKEIFSQVVTFCKEMDLIGSSISIDGTKVKANASPRQSKSSDALEKEIDKILKESIETDKHEDEIYGDSTPYQIPEELVDKKKRLEKIKAAKKKLDEEKLKKVNITDNDARIMKHKDGSKKPSYNCQVAVDEKEQIIVAADVVNEENDLHQMEPMIQNVKNTLGDKPTIVLADAGYFSYDNVEFLLNEEIDAYIPDNFYKAEKEGKTRKFRKALFKYDEEKDCYYCPAAFEIPFIRIQKRKGEPDLRYYVCSYCSKCVLKNACTMSGKRTITRDPREHLMEDMRAKLNTEKGTEKYQKRMSTVEPVFGQMKQDRGFREFLLRGKGKTKIEFVMMCTVHNIRKIADFMKREGKNLKEILNMITRRGNECGNRWGSVAGMAHKLW
ncbi:IS1182-like element ISMac2 family transposase [Methanosarcina acetivorans]|uniref:Transposase n=2 Tax=Methanosarcina TaxID=2207 RepID=Q8TPC7_METAC|nr:IS1182-like element ISMac2 family transposase [Methanosarcina acetivorans]AAM05389.1 transposase [Methanosarcina acetivorans C2A]